MRPVLIKKGLLNQIIQHAKEVAPVECCGLLSGQEGVVSHLHRMSNTLKSAVRFGMDPQELFHFFRGLRATGQTHLGIYHSHPASRAYPSDTDIQESFYPDCSYFIVSLKDECSPQLRAFRIAENKVDELEIIEIE